MNRLQETLQDQNWTVRGPGNEARCDFTVLLCTKKFLSLSEMNTTNIKKIVMVVANDVYPLYSGPRLPVVTAG